MVSIIGHNVLSDTRPSRPPNESAQAYHEFIVRGILSSTDHTKTDYSKSRKIRFFLPWREGRKKRGCIRLGLNVDSSFISGGGFGGGPVPRILPINGW